MRIETWKEILTPVGLRPIIFFRPSIDFMTYCKNNHYSNIPIMIQGTDGVYDGIYYVSIDIKTDKISCGSRIPLQYAAVLNRDFTILPSQKGYVLMAFKNDTYNSVQSPIDKNSQKDIKVQKTDDFLFSPVPNSQKPENFSSSEIGIQDSDNFNTPTPTSMQNCTTNSLNLWQIILMIIILILILVACFLCYF